MDTIKQIAAFLKVAELKSFTTAAEELQMSASAVSKYVSQLESSLGVKLLARTTRRIELTNVGQTYFTRCEAAFKELRAASDEAAYQDNQLRGPVRVHTSPGIGQRVLVPALIKFMKLYPEIALSLTMGGTPHALLGGDIDLLVNVSRRGESRGGSVHCTELVENSLLVCAAPEYLNKHGRPSTPEDLRRHNCLVQTSQRHGADWHFRQSDETSATIRVSGSFTTDSASALEEAMLAGQGIGRISTYIAGRYVRDNQLVVLFDNVISGGDVISAFYPGARCSARVTALIAFLKEEIAESVHAASPPAEK
jgi:DNA-binding transcriptional LysR family regulator